MEKSNSVTTGNTAIRQQRGVISRRNSRVASNLKEKPFSGFNDNVKQINLELQPNIMIKDAT